MKGRRAWKKALAGVLTGALLIGTLSTVSASTSVSDVDASGWWVSHSEGIQLEDGIKTTITFTGTTYDSASYNWNAPIYVVYTADDYFYGGADISSTEGYTEYYVMRADVYGWEGAGSLGASYETISTPADWDAWLTESKAGMEGTITATLDDSTLTVDYVYGDAETVATITVDASKLVYLSLTGEECEVTDISYDMENAKTVTDLTATITDVQIGDRFSMNGKTATLTFEDGSTADVTFDTLEEIIFKGYYIEYDGVYNADGDYFYDAIFSSGEYTVYFYVYDYDFNYIGAYPVTFTVSDLYADSLDATALTLGGSESVTLSNGADSQWYYYTCTEDNLCLFVSSDNYTVDEDGYYDYDNPFGILYVLNEDGTLSYVDYDNNSADEDYNFAIKYSLKKDTTYYLKARLYYTSSSESASYTVSLKEAKDIAGISIDSLSVTSFTQFVDSLNETGTSLTITYEDGSTETATVSGDCAVDSYLNYIDYYIEDSSTGYTYWGYDKLYVNPGTYTIYFVAYNLDEEKIITTASVEVVATDFTTIANLGTEYTSDAKALSYVWYTYTPSEDGDYYFPLSHTTDATVTYSNSYINDILYQSENGDYISAEYAYDEEGYNVIVEENDAYYNAYSLKTGTTYYIGAYYYAELEAYDSETGDYSVTYYDGIVTLSVNKVGGNDSEDNTEDNSETGTEENSEGGSEDSSESESTEDTGSEDADSEDTDSEDTDSEDADTEDSGSDATDSGDSDSEDTVTLAETTITSTTAWSAITTSALTISGDSTTTYTVTIDEAYGDDWFSVEVYDGDGNYITLNSDGTYWYYGTEGDDIVMTGSAITLEEGATYTVEIIREGSDFTVTFYDEEGNELLSYYAANTNIDETAATHVYAQVGSYTVSGEATGTEASLDTTGEDSGETTDGGSSDDSGDSSASATNSVITTGSSTVSGSPKTGDAGILLLALMAAFGCMITAISCKKKFLG